jgi:hypothetical protein
MRLERFFVRVDLDRLRAGLSSSNRYAMTTEEVRRWLVMMGNKPEKDGWLADSRALRRLEPKELLEMEPVAARY